MSKSYYASVDVSYRYIGIDASPPNSKVQLLTKGGTAIYGNGSTVGTIAWAPLVKRDRRKEEWLAIFNDGSLTGKECLRLLGLMQDNADAMYAWDNRSTEETTLMGWDFVRLLFDTYGIKKIIRSDNDKIERLLAASPYFKRTIKCCDGVPGKFCGQDTYTGDLSAFITEYLSNAG